MSLTIANQRTHRSQSVHLDMTWLAMGSLLLLLPLLSLRLLLLLLLLLPLILMLLLEASAFLGRCLVC